MESRLKIIAVALLLLGDNVCHGWGPWSRSAPVPLEDQVPSISIPWAYSDRNPNRYANLIKDIMQDAANHGWGQLSSLLPQMQDILRDRGTAAQAAINGARYQKRSFFGQSVEGMFVFSSAQNDTVSVIRGKIDVAGKALRAAYLGVKQSGKLADFFKRMNDSASMSFMDIIANINPSYNPAKPNQAPDPEEAYDDTMQDNSSLGGAQALSAVPDLSAASAPKITPKSVYTLQPSSQPQALSLNLYLKQFAQKYGLVSSDSAFNGQIIKILSTANPNNLEKSAGIFNTYNRFLKLSEKADKAIFISKISPYVDVFNAVCSKMPQVCVRIEAEPFETVFMEKLVNALKNWTTKGTF